MEKFEKLLLKDQERIRDIINQKLNQFMLDIEDVTGYYVECEWDIYADKLRKTLDVDIDLALLVRPHTINERKVKHYLKYNPDNCLNQKIIAFKYNNWYEIYNGVHRTECARKLGKKTIKADIIIPSKKSLEERKLI